MFCCVCGTYQQETFMHTHLKVSILCASVCTVRSGTSLLCGGECLHRGSRVSHLDASSCDGNRNGQKSEAGTANGSLKLVGMVTPVSHSSFSLSVSTLPFFPALIPQVLCQSPPLSASLSPPLSPLLPLLTALCHLALVAVSSSFSHQCLPVTSSCVASSLMFINLDSIHHYVPQPTSFPLCLFSWMETEREGATGDRYLWGRSARLSQIFQIHVLLLNRTSAGKLINNKNVMRWRKDMKDNH